MPRSSVVPWILVLACAASLTACPKGEGEGEEGEGEEGEGEGEEGEGEGEEGEGEEGEGEGEGEGEPRAAYYTQGGRIYDPCGEELIMRGVNKMAVYADRSGNSFPEIASVGSNTVRFMWFTDVPASEAVQTLERAVDANLVPMWELHDATGNFGAMGAIADFWTNPGTIEVLRQFESRVLVNIANEGGATVDDNTWVSTYTDIISDLRAEGLRMPMVIDAAGWGRNVEQLLDLAPQLVEADPLHNLIFSWHVYNPGSAESARMDTAFADAAAAELPLIVGEFGPVSPGACSQAVPYLDVIRKAEAAGIGYLPWSWDNFNGDCNTGSGSAFDMVSDGIHASTLNAGYASEVVLTDAASIQNTSVLTTWQLQGSCD